jgi:LuxR family transcriptional regulator
MECHAIDSVKFIFMCALSNAPVYFHLRRLVLMRRFFKGVVMKGWAEELLTLTMIDHCDDERTAFAKIEAGARTLGFEYCAYGLRAPLPLTNPKILMVNNYSSAWKTRYAEAGYLAIDPTVQHGRRTTAPLVWRDKTFSEARDLWADARSAGLRVGWAQSSLDGYGVGGMLTLVRSHERLTLSELAVEELKMRWLVNIAHVVLTRVLMRQLHANIAAALTPREIEVLKWHADGKTSGEISEILNISLDTVKFHTKNAVQKLGAANKTSAVVRAAMLGLLN